MWNFDPLARYQLQHIPDGHQRKLKTPEANVLELLLVNEGNVVSKESLIKAGWGTRPVSSSSLPQAIAQLRLALGDNGRQQNVIKTYPKSGYMVLPKQITMQLTSLPTFTKSEKKPLPQRSTFPLFWVKKANHTLLMAIVLLMILLVVQDVYRDNDPSSRLSYYQFDKGHMISDNHPQSLILFEQLKNRRHRKIQTLFIFNKVQKTAVTCYVLSPSHDTIEMKTLYYDHQEHWLPVITNINQQCQIP
ncbi:winged helix-turn-helix domain-containing protein [Vibrio ostreicida]|uniref:Winged helix-turn-helix domain-containing protein n=1 Tax=Vibrio ostreicida TaxID=526588 RepID=A0ABT8BUF3_9VIBR|nr:winged helix-turn-helix domain-containing protein [Vibrio ostreicida]MDN3609700.1 winged helix-turn-helix domain-containing protein [Vibrio ostreicida]NPD09469.1 hypothetical protein [Vibrio ostreicida]